MKYFKIKLFLNYEVLQNRPQDSQLQTQEKISRPGTSRAYGSHEGGRTEAVQSTGQQGTLQSLLTCDINSKSLTLYGNE